MTDIIEDMKARYIEVRQESIPTYKGWTLDIRVLDGEPKHPEITIKDGHLIVRACCPEHLHDAADFLLRLGEAMPQIVKFGFSLHEGLTK